MANGEFNFSSFLSEYVAKVKEIVTKPEEFFNKMPVTGGFNDPLMFILPAAIVYGVGSMLVGAGFKALIFGVIITYVAIFIGSAILHIIAILFKGTGSFEATFRVGAYSSVVYLVAWIPVLGIVSLYGLVLWFFGLRKVHSLSTEKTIIVLLIPIAIAIVIGASIIAMFGLAYFSMGR